MSSSDMDETNLVSGEQTLMVSGEIPIPTETSPFCVTPLRITLLLRYHALADVMSSRSLLTISMWSRTITLTWEPFMPQIHNVTVTSILTILTVCVASLTPVVNAITAFLVVTTVARPSASPLSSGLPTSTSSVVNTTLIAPPSSGSIPAGGAYDQYLQALQNLDPQNPFHYYDS